MPLVPPPPESWQVPVSCLAEYVSPPGHDLTQTAVNMLSNDGEVSVKYLYLYSVKSLAFGTITFSPWVFPESSGYGPS